jgi:hypothetical protein
MDKKPEPKQKPEEPDKACYPPDCEQSPQDGRGGWSDKGYQRGSIAERFHEQQDKENEGL